MSPAERRQRLFLAGYGLIACLGLVLAQASSLPGVRAFGLGLMAPGGGFLAYASLEEGHGLIHLGLFGISLALFALALLLWFTTGNVLAPPLVWGAAALAALWMNHPLVAGPFEGAFLVLPTGIAVLAGCTWFTGLILRRRAHRQAGRDADYLASVEVPRAQAEVHGRDELSLEDIRRLRFLYDRALQPVEAFEGFQWIEQFQTSAVRYQLCFSGYALALAQRRLPAFRGYLHEAQVRLIEKQCDHRVWCYWLAENTWGNLRLEADPVSRDNIMYAGFLAAQIAYFQAATGDRRFSQPGSLPLSRGRSVRYRYDYHGLVAALYRGWDKSRLGLMACEPHWVYPLCNAIGAGAAAARDRQFGGDDWSRREVQFRRDLDRNLKTTAGRLVPFRSSLTGIAAPRLGGAVADAFPSLFLNAVLADEAWRNWLLARRDMLARDGCLDRRRFWPVDTGDYRPSRAISYAGVAATAVEMGDPEVAEMALDALDRACPQTTDGGIAHRRRASVFAHAVELMARCGQAEGIAGLVKCPRVERAGPYLDTLDYPAVQVAAAASSREGLSLVLYPGDRPRPLRLALAGFAPNQPFVIAGAVGCEGRADEEGRATIEFTLTGRTELCVRS